MGKSDFCCAPGCTHARDRGATCSFYTFPVDTVRRNKWLSKISRCVIGEDGTVKPWQPANSSRLCSCHFEEHRDPKSRVKWEGVPSIFDFGNTTSRKPVKEGLVYERPAVEEEGTCAVEERSRAVKKEESRAVEDGRKKTFVKPKRNLLFVLLRCCVPLCSSNTRYTACNGISFYRFPKDEELKQLWIKNIARDNLRRKFLVNAHSCVCSKHFERSAFLCGWLSPEDEAIFGPLRKRLCKFAVPTIFHKSAVPTIFAFPTPRPAQSTHVKTCANENIVLLEHSYSAQATSVEDSTSGSSSTVSVRAVNMPRTKGWKKSKARKAFHQRNRMMAQYEGQSGAYMVGSYPSADKASMDICAGPEPLAVYTAQDDTNTLMCLKYVKTETGGRQCIKCLHEFSQLEEFDDHTPVCFNELGDYLHPQGNFVEEAIKSEPKEEPDGDGVDNEQAIGFVSINSEFCLIKQGQEPDLEKLSSYYSDGCEALGPYEEVVTGDVHVEQNLEVDESVTDNLDDSMNSLDDLGIKVEVNEPDTGDPESDLDEFHIKVEVDESVIDDPQSSMHDVGEFEIKVEVEEPATNHPESSMNDLGELDIIIKVEVDEPVTRVVQKGPCVIDHLALLGHRVDPLVTDTPCGRRGRGRPRKYPAKPKGFMQEDNQVYYDSYANGQDISEHMEVDPTFLRTVVGATQQEYVDSQTMTSPEHRDSYDNLLVSGDAAQEADERLTGDWNFECADCLCKFKRKDLFQRHMLIHTGETPYSCDLCHCKFKRKDHLKNHMRIHTGETPYSCHMCPASFRQYSQLSHHLRQKHGVSPVRKEKLKKNLHKNVSDVNHNATVSNKLDRRNINKNVRSKKKDRLRFQCEDCLRMFKQQGHLRRHIMNIHHSAFDRPRKPYGRFWI